MSIAGATVIAETDYGTDVNVSTDFQPVWGIASGLTNLVNALIRRLYCPRGRLLYDPNYGTDIRAYLNRRVTTNSVALLQQDIAAELPKDDRVQSASAQANFVLATKTMVIGIQVVPVVGVPFQFVIAATDVTIALLSINGVPANTVAPSLPVGSQVFVGPPGKDGQPGPQGEAGSGGAAQAFLDYDEDEGDSQSGNEDVCYERYVNFGALPTSLTCEFGGYAFSQAGTATFKLRVGGTPDTADGTVVATASTGSNMLTPVNDSTSGFSNPGGWQLVKITVKSSALNQQAGIRKRTATFR